MRTVTIAVLAVATLAACSKKKDEKPSGPEGHDHAHDQASRAAKEAEPFERTDLSEAGLEASIEAPPGVEVSEALGAVRLSADHFGLEVSRGAADLDAIVASWREDEVNQLARLVTEEPDLVIGETELLGRSEYHFAAAVGDFTCQDQRERQWTRAQIDRMVEACRSLRGE